MSMVPELELQIQTQTLSDHIWSLETLVGSLRGRKGGGCRSVTRSAKLGITSLLLVGSIFVPPFAEWRQPLSFLSAVLSCVFGVLAARQGSKWWLAIPGAIAA